MTKFEDWIQGPAPWNAVHAPREKSQVQSSCCGSDANVSFKYRLERDSNTKPCQCLVFLWFFWGKLQVITRYYKSMGQSFTTIEGQMWDACSCRRRLQMCDKNGIVLWFFRWKMTGSGWWIYWYGDTTGGDPASWQGELDSGWLKQPFLEELCSAAQTLTIITIWGFPWVSINWLYP